MNNLDRFIIMQEKYFNNALQEIKDGKKKTHWMWYIFPQIEGLGFSKTSKYYAIKNIDEAKAYLKNNFLRSNLIEITHALLELENNNIEDILGYPDNLKLKSSMTLFNFIEPNTIFKKVLDKYYNGEIDKKTIFILEEEEKK